MISHKVYSVVLTDGTPVYESANRGRIHLFFKRSGLRPYRMTFWANTCILTVD